MDDARERVYERFRAQHGVIARRQALAAGYGRSRIQRHLDQGEWIVEERGIYRVASTPLTAQALLAIHVLCSEGIASHRAAARVWGIDRGRWHTIEITVPRGQSYRRDWVVTHESTQFDLVDATQRGGVEITGIDRTILDLGAVVRFDAVEQAAEEALRRRLTTWARLHDALRRHSEHGRDGCGVLRAVLEERYGDPVVPLSEWSRLVARWVDQCGFAKPRLEHRILDAVGDHLLQADLAWPDQRVAMELDSVEFHLNRPAFERDRDTRNRLRALGWTVIEVTWSMWERDRPRLFRLLRTALDAQPNDLSSAIPATRAPLTKFRD